MARSDNKDPKLSEVKAVLQRLQGFETEPDEPNPTKRAGAEPRSGRGAAVITGALVLATALGLFGAAYMVSRPTPRAPDAPVVAKAPTARTPTVSESPPDVREPGAASSSQRMDPAPPNLKTVLEAARTLMAKGKVRAAREQLLALASKGSPDAAWDLARSYDPNVLAALPADASPDVKEATRWYRAWYAAAVRDGLVADSVSLERIIGSMRQ